MGTPSPLDTAFKAWAARDHATALEHFLRAVGDGVDGAAASLFDCALEAGLGDADALTVRQALETSLEAGNDGRFAALIPVSGLGAAPDWSAAIMRRRHDAEREDRRAALELALLELQAGCAAATARLEQAALAGSGEAVAALLRVGLTAGVMSSIAADRATALVNRHPLGAMLAHRAQSVPRAGAAGETSPIDPQRLGDVLSHPPGAMSPLTETGSIRTVTGAVPAALCDYVLAASTPYLKPAEIFDPASRTMHADPHRRSLSAALPPSAMDLPSVWVRARMAALGQASPVEAEPLAILVYRPGDEYRPHFDFITADDGTASADLARRGQRKRTVLLSLADEHEGGATHFSRLQISWRGSVGDALVFDNLTPDGDGDPLSLHAGAPVTAGTKALASLWLRER